MRPGERVPALTNDRAAAAGRAGEEELLALLADGEMELLGAIGGASNTTLLARVRQRGREQAVVYKPVRGERPLWDFPDGTLAGREVASYEVSRAGGWGVVPPTVLRDGPVGPGSVQQWVGARGPDGQPAMAEPGDGLVDVFAPLDVPDGWPVVVRGSGYGGEAVVVAHADEPDLRAMALFDAAVNNADRKAGHVLRAGEDAGPVAGRVVGVDHGLAMNVEPKLRTVLWGFGGERLGETERPLVATLEALGRSRRGGDGRGGPCLRDVLEPLVTDAEVRALRRRCEVLAERGRFPRSGARGPSMPWPIF